MMTIQFNGTPIHVGSLESGPFNALLEEYSTRKKVIVVDENTHDCCLEYLLTAFPSLEDAEVMLLPAGEENKALEVCYQVWSAMLEYQINRTDLVINLGGGVVTDLGGFIASVYKRGVDFIHIPTSLMGMVDAAIGGKNGVDLNGLKNIIGTITQPTCSVATGDVALSGLPSSGSWTVTASPGAATITGSGTTGNFTGLSVGTSYTFTVTNAGGCSGESAPTTLTIKTLTGIVLKSNGDSVILYLK